MNGAVCPKKIVFATVGSLGDLHPCLVLGQELAKRGHHITVATTASYKSKVEGSARDAELADRLERFLSDGDAPLVFTQGSTAVHNPRDFYDISAEVARRLGRRALLVGTDRGYGNDILSLPYAPYGELFPRAGIIVHQGGSGTTGDALRAGRPMLVVPYGWDQPDNAMRVERLGAGLHLPRKQYVVEAATRAIRRLLEEPQFAAASAKIGPRVQQENAAGSACDAICALLESKQA